MDEGSTSGLKRVWDYFQVLNEGQAQCRICPSDPITNQGKIIKTKNGSTTGLHTHLKLHNVVAIKRARRLTPREGPQFKYFIEHENQTNHILFEPSSNLTSESTNHIQRTPGRFIECCASLINLPRSSQL